MPSGFRHPRAGPHANLRLLLSCVFLLILITGQPAPVHAASETPEAVSAVANQLSSTEHDDKVPAVAYDSTRNEYLVVWEYAFSDTDTDIYARRVGAGGVGLGDRFTVIAATRVEGAPAVAFNPPAGEYLVVWHEAYSSTDYDIYAMRQASGSSVAGTRFTVAAESVDQRNPAVGYDPISGGYLVVWQQLSGSDEFAHYDIVGQRLNAAGQAVGARITFAAGPLDEKMPAVAQNRTSAGTTLVVWQQKHSGRTDQDVASRLVASNGSLPNSITPIATWEGDQLRPRVAYNPAAAEFMVVWEDRHYGDAAGYDVYSRRVRADGTLVGSDNVLIAGAGTAHNTNPDITYTVNAGHYLVVWEYRITAGDTDVMGVWLNGATAAPALGAQVTNAGGQELRPAVAASSGLPSLVAWQDNRDQATQGLNIYGGIEQLYRLSGRVFRGAVGNESTPLAGVTVDLYCSNSPDPLGDKVGTATTSADGSYAILVLNICEYFNLVQVDLPGYTSDGATSVSGAVINANRVRITGPLAGKTLSDNKFWDQPPPEIATCTSCEDCEAKINGAYGEVRLAQDLDITGSCVLVQANNKVLSCQGHTIHGHMGELTFGVRLRGDNNTVSGCTISGFETGISVLDGNNNQVLSNVLTGNGRGISLHGSNGNTVQSNQVLQNQHGIYFSTSNSNQFAGNRVCNQKLQDLFAVNATTGNSLGNTQCDSIYNWNNDGDVSACGVTCTPNASITVATPTDLQAALGGSYNNVSLTGNIAMPEGLVFGANHATLNCNGHTITGSGTGAGILIADRLGASVRNCQISGFGTGIEIRGSVQGEVKDSTLSNNSTGLTLIQSSTTVKPAKNVVSGNQITGNAFFGVRFTNAGQNSLLNNNLSNNGQYGLWISGGCNQTITGNQTGTGGALAYHHDLPVAGSLPGGTVGGVYLCNVEHASLVGVQINNGSAKNDGIVVIDAGASNINGGTVRNARGIIVVGSHHINVFNNQVLETVEGISLSQSPSGQVYDNTVRDGSGPGITVGAGSNSTQVTNNTITNNLRGLVVDSASGGTYSGNTITEHDEEGMALSGPGGGAISGNTLTNNRFGLYFSNTTGGATVNTNKICYNTTKDVYNNGASHSGDANTCAETYFWRDSGLPADGCKQKCIGWYQYRYGYSFKNPSKYPLSFGCPFGGCQGDYVDTFGESQVYLSAPICIGIPLCFPFLGCACLGYETSIPTPIPDPHAVVYYAAAYHHSASPGECTGMSNTSLRFFFGNRYPSEYKSGATRASELTYSGNLENALDASQGSIMSKELAFPFLDWYMNGASTNAVPVLNQVQQALDRNEPLSLVMFNKSSAHTVVATAVRDLGTTARIYLYDSNYPEYSTKYATAEDLYPYVEINKSANSFSYPKNTSFTGIYALPFSLTNGKFTIPLSVQHLIGWGSVDTQVEDSQSRVLGWRDGQLATQIPNAAPMPNWGTVEQAPEYQHYFLPDGDYSVHFYGKSTGPYNAAFFRDQSLVSLENVGATAQTHDTLGLSYKPGEPAIPMLRLSTLDAAKPFSLTIGARFTDAQGVRLYSIQGATFANGAPVWITLDQTYNSLIFANRGAVARTYTVEFRNSMVADAGALGDTLPVARRANLTIPAMTTHVLAPSDWLRLAQSEVVLQAEACGNGVCGLGETGATCPEDCGAASCVVPVDDLNITTSTRLCPGVYNLPDQGQPGVLRITGNALTLDCNGARLVGNGGGTGIFSHGASDITLNGCAVEGYATGIRLEEVTRPLVMGSSLWKHAEWGLNLISVQNAQVRQSFIGDNQGGLRLASVTGAQVSQNMLCGNTDDDLRAEGGAQLAGAANSCDHAANWNDAGVTGCAYTCSMGAGAPLMAALISPAHGAAQPLGPVTFQWQGPMSATRYQLQVDDDPAFGSPSVDVTVTNPGYTCAALTQGTYHWRVRVGDANQWYGWCQPWQVTLGASGSGLRLYLPQAARQAGMTARQTTLDGSLASFPYHSLLPLCTAGAPPAAGGPPVQPFAPLERCYLPWAVQQPQGSGK